jgi:hypothetical protein
LKRYSIFSKAIYYELLGVKDKALQFYVEMLNKDDLNTKAKISIRRLSGTYAKFNNLNKNQYDKFVNIDNEKDLLEFKTWLMTTE